MTDWDAAIDPHEPADPIGTALTWAACGCIWAIHLTTYPFQYAGRSKSNRDAINLHDGGIN